MGRFINPFTDVGFKRIFGQSVHKDLLIDFLNNLLEGEKQIKDISFLDKELLPEFQGDRGTIYDIYCTTGRARSSSLRCRTASRLISVSVRFIICAVRCRGRANAVRIGNSI